MSTYLSGFTDGIPIGGIFKANNLLPLNSNYLLCDGSSYLKSSYPAISSSFQQAFTWSKITLSSSAAWNACAYDSSLGIWVMSNTSGGAGSATAPATLWTARSMPAASSYPTMCSNNAGTFVAIGTGSTNVAAQSTNGTSWNARTLPVTTTWTNVVWNGTKFIVIGTTALNFIVVTSSDGITWSIVSTLSNLPSGPQAPFSIAADPATGTILAFISNQGSTMQMSFKSTDNGLSWVGFQTGLAISSSVTQCVYNGSKWWMATVQTGGVGGMVSANAIQWNSFLLPQPYSTLNAELSGSANPWTVANCGGTFVVAGKAAAGGRGVYLSQDGVYWTVVRDVLVDGIGPAIAVASDGTNILIIGSTTLGFAAWGVPDSTKFILPSLTYAGNYYIRAK